MEREKRSALEPGIYIECLLFRAESRAERIRCSRSEDEAVAEKQKEVETARAKLAIESELNSYAGSRTYLRRCR